MCDVTFLENFFSSISKPQCCTKFTPRSRFKWTGQTITAISLSFLLLLTIVSPVVRAETIMGVSDDEFDFDGLPGAQHDFKIYVPAGTEECLWQPVAQGAQFYVRFEVLKGGDQHVDFFVRDISGQVLDKRTGSKGFFSWDNINKGVYGMCIDNIYDRFGYKIIYVYMVSLVMEDWMQFQEELQTVSSIAANFTESIKSVDLSLKDMRLMQTKSRFDVVRDWYQVNSNLYYVGMWSAIQCVVIILASCGQVYFVRRLFQIKTTTPTTAKPRA